MRDAVIVLILRVNREWRGRRLGLLGHGGLKMDAFRMFRGCPDTEDGKLSTLVRRFLNDRRDYLARWVPFGVPKADYADIFGNGMPASWVANHITAPWWPGWAPPTKPWVDSLAWEGERGFR